MLKVTLGSHIDDDGAGEGPSFGTDMAPGVPLTQRQLEVMYFVAMGLSDEQIAGELDVAIGTVRHHVGDVYERLGLHNRVQAAVWVVISGWVDGAMIVAELQRLAAAAER